WGPRSAFLPCFILGALTCFIIPTCIVWSPAVVSLRMAWSGFPAERDFSCPSESSPGCFVVYFWNLWSKPLMPAKWSFSPRWNHSGTDLHSWITWLPPTRPNGSSTPSGLSPAPEQVLDYVGRYTHRVAISNSRLLDITRSKVAFRYKDYRHDAQQK